MTQEESKNRILQRLFDDDRLVAVEVSTQYEDVIRRLLQPNINLSVSPLLHEGEIKLTYRPGWYRIVDFSD